MAGSAVVVTGHVLAPTVTRVATSILTAAARSDALQYADAALSERGAGGAHAHEQGPSASGRQAGAVP